MAKPERHEIVQYVAVQQRLTADAARQLAQDYPHQIYLTLHAGWDTTAALDALLQATGTRLQTLYILEAGTNFWPWLQSGPPLREVILPGSLIPEDWAPAYDAPLESLWFTGIPGSRTRLDLSVFRAIEAVHLGNGGPLALRLNGKVTSLSLDRLSAEPDDSWASLRHLGIDSNRLDLGPLLAASPQLESLQLAWPFRMDNLESLLASRHWKRIEIVGNPGMPTGFIDRLWEAKVADEITCRHFPGPFWEDTFTNGKWEGYCTR